jgi:hypothetical protein
MSFEMSAFEEIHGGELSNSRQVHDSTDSPQNGSRRSRRSQLEQSLNNQADDDFEINDLRLFRAVRLGALCTFSSLSSSLPLKVIVFLEDLIRHAIFHRVRFLECLPAFDLPGFPRGTSFRPKTCDWRWVQG